MDLDRFVLLPFLHTMDAVEVLPSLCSELAFLQTLQDLLQRRLSLSFPASGVSNIGLSRLDVERE